MFHSTTKLYIYKLFLLLTVLVSIPKIGSAQSEFFYPNFFLQNNSTPLFYNPGFAGTAAGPRINLAANNYFREYTNVYGSYDQFVEKIGSGVGVFAQYNQFDKTDFFYVKGLRLGACIAPKITLKDKLTFSPSASIFYKNTKVDIPYGEFYGRPAYSKATSQVDMKFGFLLNSRNFYTGLTIGDFAKIPNDSLLFMEFTRVNFTLQGGGTIKISDNFSFQPAVVFQIGRRRHYFYQGKETYTTDTVYTDNTNYYLDSTVHHSDIITGFAKKWQPSIFQINLNIKYKKLITGIGTNIYTIFGVVGYQNDRFKIMTSLGILRPNLGINFLGDVAISYVFKQKSGREWQNEEE